MIETSGKWLWRRGRVPQVVARASSGSTGRATLLLATVAWPGLLALSTSRAHRLWSRARPEHSAGSDLADEQQAAEGGGCGAGRAAGGYK